MPSDIGRIPIISFSSCKYLTNVVSELPLPSAQDFPMRCQTLLYDSKIAHQAYNCINCQDDKLINVLINSLECTKNDILKEDIHEEDFNLRSNPPTLLEALLNKKPNLFSKKNDNFENKLLEESKRVPPLTLNLTNKNDKKQTKRKTKKEKTYNATCVAPLRISIKKSALQTESKTLGESKSQSKEKKVVKKLKNNDCVISNSNNLIKKSTVGVSKHNEPSSVTLFSNVHSLIDDTNVKYSKTDSESHYECAKSESTVLTEFLNPLSVSSISGAATSNTNPNLISVQITSKDVENSPKCTNPLLSGETNHQSKRIHDPALSQIFHPVTLFQSYQVHADHDKDNTDQGEGLFDHLNDSNKSQESSYHGVLNPTIDPVSSHQAASSDPTLLSNSSQILIFDSTPSISPKSHYPSHSSNPSATHSVPLSKNSVINLSCLNGPSLIAQSASTSTRLFDVDENVIMNATSCSDIAFDKNSYNSTPHGLAAYLPRLTNQRHTNTKLGSFLNDDVPIPSLSPKPILSPCITDIDSVSPADAKSNQMTNSDMSSPSKSQHVRMSSKMRGRRRRTELEELKRWSVADHANADQKCANSLLKDWNFNGTDEYNKDSSCIDRIQTNDGSHLLNKESKLMADDEKESMADYGGFTEALVERVKRRRQQRETEAKRTNNGTPRGLMAELSPTRVSRSLDKSHSSRLANKNQSFLNLKSEDSQRLYSDERAARNLSDSKTKYINSVSSDASVSPASTDLFSTHSPTSDPESVPPPMDVPSFCESSQKLSDKSLKDISMYKSLSSTSFKNCDLQNTIHRTNQSVLLSDGMHSSLSSAVCSESTVTPKLKVCDDLSMKSTKLLREESNENGVCLQVHNLKKKLVQATDSNFSQDVLRNVDKNTCKMNCEKFQSMNDVSETKCNDNSSHVDENNLDHHTCEKVIKRSSTEPKLNRSFDSSRQRLDLNVTPTPNTKCRYLDGDNDSIDSTNEIADGETSSICSSQHCCTPSTLAYTHSSAMEDNDEYILESGVRRTDVASDLDSPRSENGDTDHYSPSSLSTVSSTGRMSSDEDGDDESQLGVDMLNRFTGRLVKILRRVEELDLVHLAAQIQSRLGQQSVKSIQSDDDESVVPHSAQLTKHDVVVLCSESGKIRAAGSMFTIPTGRLVRFLTLLLVNMQKAAYLIPDLAKLVRLLAFVLRS